MTITISKVTKDQWFKVLKVALYLILSFIPAGITAFVTKHAQWLALAPGFNLLMVSLTQLFQNGEVNAQSELSSTDLSVRQ